MARAAFEVSERRACGLLLLVRGSCRTPARKSQLVISGLLLGRIDTGRKIVSRLPLVIRCQYIPVPPTTGHSPL